MDTVELAASEAQTASGPPRAAIPTPVYRWLVTNVEQFPVTTMTCLLFSRTCSRTGQKMELNTATRMKKVAMGMMMARRTRLRSRFCRGTALARTGASTGMTGLAAAGSVGLNTGFLPLI